MDDTLTPLGRLLETARRAKRPKLSQNATAKAARTSSTTYRRIISGTSRFGGQDVPFSGSADTVARIARALGVTPDQLEEVGRSDAAEELRMLGSSEEPAAEEPTVEGLATRIAELRAEADRLEREMRRLAEAGDEDAPDLDRARHLMALARRELDQVRRARK